MTKDDIDKLWHQAMSDSIKNGEDFTRHRFAHLVAEAEREACAAICEQEEELRDHTPFDAALRIRARGCDDRI
jgi:hypothetical protein